MVAPSACEPGKDTPVTFLRVSTTQHKVSDSFWPSVRPVPRVSPLHSQVAFRFTGQRCLFRHRRPGGRFSRVLPRPRVLPGTLALFVPPFGVFHWAAPRFPETSARVTRPCWCRSNNRLPSGQLRFAQARNWLELLHSTHRGFSSRLAARFLSRLWHVRPCQKNR